MSELRVNNVSEVGGDAVIASGVLDSGSLPAGSILQVVQDTYSTTLTTTSTSYIDSSLELSITPSSSSSKILLFSTLNVRPSRTNNNSGVALSALFRGATELIDGRSYIQAGGSSSGNTIQVQSLSYLDSPNTTSATTYKVQVKIALADTADFFEDNSVGTLIALEVAG